MRFCNIIIIIFFGFLKNLVEFPSESTNCSLSFLIAATNE